MKKIMVSLAGLGLLLSSSIATAEQPARVRERRARTEPYSPANRYETVMDFRLTPGAT